MKNISILKTIKVIQVIALIIILIRLFLGKSFGESVETVLLSLTTVLLGIVLILVFGFGKRLEQEKIDREERKREARKNIV